MPRRIALLVGLPAIFLCVAAWIFADWLVTIPDDRQPQYVGREACRGCHDRFIDMWAGTSHDLAMDHATPKTVLGQFGSEKSPSILNHFKTPFRMFRQGNSFFIETIGASGKLEKFQVKYVFGAVVLQQYLVEMPGGKIQAIPIAWDVKGKRWYHLYPNEPLPPSDPLHWTRRLQNWNYMCAECHVTNYDKGYDAKTDTYHTTFGEIDVSCESCHGPCSLHVELARSGGIFWDRKIGKGIPNPRDPKIEIDSCAPCHARRQHIYPGFTPGKEFLDYYLPEMLNSEYYHADGQVLDENYTHGSYLQSRMYHNQVRCWTCHSSTVKYKDHRLCITCHDSKKYDTPAHHFHTPDSPGADCVDCHMPEKTYMGVDRRYDHSFSIPRPDLTIELGVPNACNSCHKDKTPEWSEKLLTEWYGKRHEPVPHFAYAIAEGRKGLPEAESKLIEVIEAVESEAEVEERAKKKIAPGYIPKNTPGHKPEGLQKGEQKKLANKKWPAYVRAGALMLLGNYPTSPGAMKVAKKNLADPDPLVRYAAVHAMEYTSPSVLDSNLGPMLTDPVRIVRIEAARILTPIRKTDLSSEHFKAFDAALDEYRKGQNYLADQPAAHLNLAVIHEGLGQPSEALTEYRHATRLDPAFVPARMNAAMLLDSLGEKKKAEAELRKAIAAEPDFGEAYYSLGLLLAEKEENLPEAAKMLARAVQLTPANARMHYNLGLAYLKLGKLKEAETALQEAQRLAPCPAYSEALEFLYQQEKQ